MAQAGLSRHAHGNGEPARSARDLALPGPARARQTSAARAAFRTDAAEELVELAERAGVAGSRRP
ncbi:hypothetical protein [Streptomyces sp. 891-h]|uniref:hypothetical protein n=1 Tax=Streptomyces sp. 891-h TaxID=2720714 RepID=UPI001FA9CF47|nr:hypothetical protein [Streptomyces sp. 891-h]